MQRLLLVCVAIIAILAIVSGNLWLQLREQRQLVADLRAQMTEPEPPVAEPVREVQLPQAAAVAAAMPAASVQPEQPVQAPPVQSAPPPPPEPPSLPPTRPAIVITPALRETAMLQADQTATGRVLAWKDRLAIDGHTLTTEQLQALNAAASAQLRREAEETLELESRPQPADLDSMVRMREETLNRQYETNLRILAAVSPQFTEVQAGALRAQFEAGHKRRMATLRAEEEMLRQSQTR